MTRKHPLLSHLSWYTCTCTFNIRIKNINKNTNWSYLRYKKMTGNEDVGIGRRENIILTLWWHADIGITETSQRSHLKRFRNQVWVFGQIRLTIYAAVCAPFLMKKVHLESLSHSDKAGNWKEVENIIFLHSIHSLQYIQYIQYNKQFKYFPTKLKMRKISIYHSNGSDVRKKWIGKNNIIH